MYRSLPILLRDFAFLLVWFHQNARITNEMRISLRQNQLHGLRIHKCHKPEHSFLLVWDPHILYRPIDTFI